MLRHRDTRTTEKYYARAMSEKAHNPDRAKLRRDTSVHLENLLAAQPVGHASLHAALPRVNRARLDIPIDGLRSKGPIPA